MIQFLLHIFEALAGFAMLSLGLSFTAEAEPCAAEVELVSADYFIADYAEAPEASSCVNSNAPDAEAVEVFRI